MGWNQTYSESGRSLYGQLGGTDHNGRPKRRSVPFLFSSSRSVILGSLAVLIVVIAFGGYYLFIGNSPPSPSTIYSYQGASFQAAFPSTPQTVENPQPSSSPGNSSSYAFGTGPDFARTIRSSTNKAPNPPLTGVVIMHFHSSNDVTKYMSEFSSNSSQAIRSVHQSGSLGYEQVALEPESITIQSKSDVTDPNAYVGFLVMSRGTDIYVSLAVDESQSYVQNFLNSFKIVTPSSG